ncbi:hypothetical protein BV22DRAFT_1042011 [Leucogyrophana mollusca]|uniref:Uncharacterized protein n=1 Tax=Leucogyrophana mollusca TaxID=85980 RepID=A0ACB8AZP3_9AGAM|nr:hypothetical protein BV22DRAFT_1042011 [Leucogyrophana mollusca]
MDGQRKASAFASPFTFFLVVSFLGLACASRERVPIPVRSFCSGVGGRGRGQGGRKRTRERTDAPTE